MTDFLSTGTLPDHYEQLAKTVRDFAQSVVAPVAAKHDEEHSFPYEVVAGMADMGLFGLPFPEEYGGMGGDYFALCLALEELGKVDQSVAITLEAGVSLGAMPVYRFGNDAQKQEWLPLLASGKALGAFGLTEAGGGSDAGATKTTAKSDGSTWVINGSKQFITNSGTDITKLVTVTAVTGETDGRKEISSILVPVPTEGFTAEPAYNKVGWNASDTHPLSFDDVRVPQENLLGERGRGYANFLRILDPGPRVPRGVLRRGRADAVGQAVQEGRRDRQAGGQRGCHGQRPRCHPDLRRLRLHERIPGRPALPRQQDPRNRRGHNGSPADADRSGAGPVTGEPGSRKVVVQRGLWFEEFETGVLYQHRPGRTITEADNVLFTTLTMNTQALHLDAAFADALPPFNQRLVNSMFTLSTLVGLSVAQLTQGTIVGNLGFSDVAFPKPLFHGDTLYAETEITEKRESKSRPGEGIVTFAHTGRNQHGDVVATASRKTMVRKRPAEES